MIRDRYGRSICEIDMRDRHGRSDVNWISIGVSICDMGHRYGIWFTEMVLYHRDMVIDMGYGLIMWEMTVSIWSYWMSIWDISSLCCGLCLSASRPAS